MTLQKHSPTQPSMAQLNELMSVANAAADAAAKVTMGYFRQPLTIGNKSTQDTFDPVTQADKEAEIAIRQVLLAAFPEIGFYGEEHDHVASRDGLTWVVDPIDGTRAFMSGMPLWGTLIGLFNGENAILGLMDQPFFNERFTAVNGLAQWQGASGLSQLTCRSGVALKESIFYCTTPDMFVSQPQRRQFEAIRDNVKLARYGGDCYAYGLLAAGFVDIVLDCDLQPYDIQALIPIIECAGGVITSWTGGSCVDGGYVAASASPALHDELLIKLAQSS